MAKEKRNPVPAYFSDFLMIPIRHFKVVTTIEINDELIPEDVLERIDGYELSREVSSEAPYGENSRTFAVNVLNHILTDKDDDTNSTTKYRIELLYKKIKNFHCFKVIE